jgi:hypothetical protein
MLLQWRLTRSWIPGSKAYRARGEGTCRYRLLHPRGPPSLPPSFLPLPCFPLLPSLPPSLSLSLSLPSSFLDCVIWCKGGTSHPRWQMPLLHFSVDSSSTFHWYEFVYKMRESRKTLSAVIDVGQVSVMGRQRHFQPSKIPDKTTQPTKSWNAGFECVN